MHLLIRMSFFPSLSPLSLSFFFFILLLSSYLAPEYFMHGKVSDRVDVYAFGVVILELLSGRKPIGGEYPKGQESLVMWVSKSDSSCSWNIFW